jgi:molybdenum cofactor cytidylyltransferase
MGRDKALLPWPPAVAGTPEQSRQTLLSAQINALKQFADGIIVVAGSNYHLLSSVTATCGAALVQNPVPERGQFSSLQIGLQEVVAQEYDAAMITLVDAPPLSAASLEKLCAAFSDALLSGLWGVAPEHGGRRGHPLLASSKLIRAFLAAPISSNARIVKHQNAEFIVSVPVEEALLAIDINTPEQYEALIAKDEQY